MHLTRLAATLSVVCLAAGCSSPTASTPLAAGRLAGSWTLTALQTADQPEQPAPANARYTLTFSDRRLSTLADCNTCSGAAAMAGLTLNVGALACTRAACPTAVFANTYTALLTGDSTITVSGSTLVLSSSRGMLRFVQ